ncbi:hypothetical protein ACFYKX_10865 [Cytobacillus sp. FJAT-54145]|uniref:ATP-dependent DNA ligase family profile domain-containing protein n=1 Tax=Cytobacillus spartinae TaxID=3299023 RepID=A0ABW6KAB0_9BACI
MFLPMMLLEARTEPFNHEDYMFEPKFNGIRLQWIQRNGEISLYTRHETLITNRFPELTESLFPFDSLTLDGELIAMNPETGLEDFELIMRRFHLRSPDRSIPVAFMVFDCLWQDGDIRRAPHYERRQLLEHLPLLPPFQLVPSLEEEGIRIWEAVTERDMEGMVAKRKNSTYVGKRSGDWLKVIRWKMVNAFIVSVRTYPFAVYCVSEEGEGLGLVEFGFDPVHKKALRGILPSITKHQNEDWIQLTTGIPCVLKSRGYTSSGKLFTPVFEDFIL